jgi:uncharacterized protein (DUF1501 family)
MNRSIYNPQSAIRNGSWSRRGFLRLAAGGVAGFSSSSWLGTVAAHAAARGRKFKSCILLFMRGGPSHIDTFDPKPEAPPDYRGPFQAIPTSLPGIHVSELFPKLAQQLQHAAILRGMSHRDAGHAGGTYLMHTGFPQNEPKVDGKPYPGLGAVVGKELGDPGAAAPNYVVLDLENPGAGRVEQLGPGFLGSSYEPLMVVDPAKGVENLRSPLEADQFRNRMALLDHVQETFSQAYQAEAIETHRTNFKRAVGLMQSQVGKAFDISQEPAALAAAYGAGRFGKQCLMARRLVEVGVPFVEVLSGGWDSHAASDMRLFVNLAPETDQAMSALVADLKERGLLETTLIVWTGEFGRTPKLSNKGGRDHYSQAFSSLLIGGGIKGGQVVGRTDKLGATVEDQPVSPADFFATIYKLLGIDPNKKHAASGGRPIRMVKEGGKPIAELVN